MRDLVEHMHLAQSTVSQQLSCLRDCGVVTVRIEGRSSWFSLTNPGRLADLFGAADRLLTAAGASLLLKYHQDHAEFEDVDLRWARGMTMHVVPERPAARAPGSRSHSPSLPSPCWRRRWGAPSPAVLRCSRTRHTLW